MTAVQSTWPPLPATGDVTAACTRMLMHDEVVRHGQVERQRTG